MLKWALFDHWVCLDYLLPLEQAMIASPIPLEILRSHCKPRKWWRLRGLYILKHLVPSTLKFTWHGYSTIKTMSRNSAYALASCTIEFLTSLCWMHERWRADLLVKLPVVDPLLIRICDSAHRVIPLDHLALADFWIRGFGPRIISISRFPNWTSMQRVLISIGQ